MFGLTALIPPQYKMLALMILAALVFCAGATSGWKLKSYFAQAHLSTVEARIAKDQQAQAEAIAQSANAARVREKQDAKQRDDVEKSYQLAAAENSRLAHRLRLLAAGAGGLRDPGTRPGCPGVPTAAAAAGVPASAAASTGDRLSAEASEFLLAESARADEVSAYASACHNWALSLVGSAP